MYAHIVDGSTSGKYQQHRRCGIQPCVWGMECTRTIHRVAPQPLAHRVAIGMYEQHAEGACGDSVYPSVVAHAQTLEEHERGNRCGHGKEHVGVGHIPVHIEMVGTDTVSYHDKPKHAEHRNDYREARNPPPFGCREFRQESVYADVGGDEVKDAEPRHIVHRDVKTIECAHQRVCEQTQRHEQSMLTPVEMRHENIEERYEQIEHEEAAGEAIGYRPYGQERKHRLSEAEMMVASKGLSLIHI